jgi:imidazolonepropionase-like amidohydrolase
MDGSIRVGLIACILVASWVGWVASAHAEFETPIVIRNARIVTGSGDVIEDGSIVVEKGRIVSVGADVEAPADAEPFDARGLIVYPGFIDGNTHAGIVAKEPGEDALKRVDDETPDPRQGPQSATVQAYRRLVHPHWRASELFNPESAKREDFRKLGFTTALVSPPAAILSGRSAVIEMGEAPLRRSVLTTVFAQHAAFVTGLARGEFPRQLRYPTTTMGAMSAFRQVFLDSQWQRDLLAWANRHPDGERPPMDDDLVSLWETLDGKIPVAFAANGENEIHRALDMAAEFGLKPIIVGGREAWKVADRLKHESVPVIVSLNWSEEPEKPKPIKDEAGAETGPARSDGDAPPKKQTPPWQDRSPLFDEKWQEQPFEPRKLFEERQRLWGEEVDNMLRLHEAGVRFAIGTFELKSLKEVTKRLDKAIERGLPADAGLTALTRDGAAVLGLGDQIGEIAAGRLANLTLMSKPLGEKKAEVKWVFVEGQPFDTSSGEKAGGGKKGGGRGAKSSEGGEEAAADEDREDEAEATSQPSTGPASQPASSPADEWEGWPAFSCETKADRKPAVQTGGSLLIKHANLLTITGGDLMETDLLIEDGRITAIGGDLTAPPGMKTADLRDYFVMPGMIDPHSHMCSEGGLNEFSLSVTPEVRVRDVVDNTDVAAFRALAGGTTTIHTMHGSANTIGGQNVVLHLKYGRAAAEWRFAEAPQTVKFALGENVKQSNFRQRGNRFPGTRMGVEAVMRRSFDAARQYESDWHTYRNDKSAGEDPRPLRRDLRLEALAAIQEGKIWVHCHCYRADEILRLLNVAETYGFRIAVLQHILEGYRVIPEMLRHGCAASTFSDWWAYKLEAFHAIPHNVARMFQRGVVATINSDSPELVRHLNLEAAKSLRFGGLAPNDALRLATLNGAIQLGIDKYVGSIEVGKLADLAVFDGHPMDTLSRCVLTLIEGEIYFQDPSLDLDAPPTPLTGKTFMPQRASLDVAGSPDGVYWIVGGTIHPVSGPPIEDGLLVISQGRISHVGPRPQESPPPGAKVVDAHGLNVYPGLINGGTPLGLIEIDSVAGSDDQRELASFQPDLLAVSAYNPFSAEVEVARSEGVTTSLIPADGGVVQGRAGFVRLDGWSMPEARIEAAAGLFVSLPSLPVRFSPRMTEKMKEDRRKEYNELMPKVEAFFRKARHYADVSALAAQDAELKPEFDRELEAMIPAMRGEMSVFFRAGSHKQIIEALRFAERYGLRPVVFGGHEAWKLADKLAEQKVDVVIVRSMAYPSGEFEPWDSVYRNAARLHQAGVRFCFAAGEPSLVKQLGIEAGMAAAFGLGEADAVRAITLDAAMILGVGDRLGSLEPGKIADVILTTDSPLQASNAVVAEFIQGRPIDLSNKHTRLDAKFLSRPAPKLPPAPTLRGPPALRMDAGKS